MRAETSRSAPPARVELASPLRPSRRRPRPSFRSPKESAVRMAEALALHPASLPSAAGDETSMHGAGPMQARFSPYDYNGGYD